MAKRSGAGRGRFERKESLGYLAHHLARSFARTLDSPRLARHKVPLGQFPLLLVLWEEENLTQSEIARRLDCEQPTVANTLRRMERDGLVETGPDPSNRRQVLIRLTEVGRSLEWPLTEEAQTINEAAAAKMSASDLDAFRRTIRLLIEGLGRGE